jgi:hypothetical protein
MQLERTIEGLRAFLPAKDFAMSREARRGCGLVCVWR